jgi:SOS response regulatory protein OraA/RecX
LDDGFDDALGDRPKKWLKGADTDDEMARYLWRSSFVVPDVSALLPLYYRSQAGFAQGEGAITDDDLRLSIQYSTIPPKFRAAVFAARWQRIAARMLRQAYDESLVDEQGVFQRLISEGIHPDDASILVAEWQKLKPAYFRRKIGAGGAAAFGKAFAAGTIGTAELVAELKAEGFTPSEISAALQEARAERRRHSRAQLIGSLHKRYLSGEVTEMQAEAVLLNSGLDAEDTAELIRLWRAEFEIHPRQVSAAELCGWYKQGLMNEGQVARALAQLRYSAEDSARIIAACNMAKMASDLKAAEAMIKKTGKNLSAAEKQWQAELKDAEKTFGNVGRRTVTTAGKQLAWVSKFVTGPPAPVSKRKPTNGATTALLPAAEGESAADIDAAVANELGGTESGLPPPPETSPGSEGAGGGASEPTLGSEPAAGSEPGPTAGP